MMEIHATDKLKFDAEETKIFSQEKNLRNSLTYYLPQNNTASQIY